MPRRGEDTCSCHPRRPELLAPGCRLLARYARACMQLGIPMSFDEIVRRSEDEIGVNRAVPGGYRRALAHAVRKLRQQARA